MATVADINERTRLAAEHWHLTLGPPLLGGTRSAVFAVTDDHQRELVLKLPATRTDFQNPTAAEASALRAWADTGATINLVDTTNDALLLTRARPGINRPWLPPQPLEDTITMAAELLTRIWAAPPGPYPFPTLVDVFPEYDRVAREDAAFEQLERHEPERGMQGLLRLHAAKVSAERLIATTAQTRLLHGDFISKNLVSDASSPTGWVALDPLPMYGDPAAEVAAFAAFHPAELILPIAEGLARHVAADVQRVLRWAAIWAVHQAAQSWRDDQTEIERLVTSGTVNDLLTR